MNLTLEEKDRFRIDVFCESDPKTLEIIEPDMVGRTAEREIIIGNIIITLFQRRG